jgi:steroid 5-alpha reductase family enzyme
MNDALFAWNAAALLVYMTTVFLIAYHRKRLDTVDAAWGGGFVVVAWLVAGLEPSARSFLIAILVDIWAVRLTDHIIQRSRKKKDDDARYVSLAKKWNPKFYWQRAYVSIFLLQGLLVGIVGLPIVFATGEAHSWALPLIILGTIVWIKGFAIEVLGDRQLRVFLADKKNKGKVLDKGLWRYTRHPNYLGEITQWYGIGIIACSTKFGWISLIGPITLNILIRFVSGVPPIEREKQKDPVYSAYMQRTNAILPKLRNAP